ncbi:acylneuraminate cytidylyltransferase family protein [Candidatus Sororendozoicomonas aggregata]|uniref:acylneuraminate cytidylyltransferase family protein n=1 Tax=Candidatus Sororendozoicomonas aggregata TaxID=3073239 RepID=UPI002ED62E41
MKNTYVAIITARGGSTGLPQKNILPLAGKPLIAHTIEAAINSGCFKKVIVTTDCIQINKISKRFGAFVIKRPVELATDNAKSCDVVEHVIQTLINEACRFTHFVLLQPTSPLRGEEHIKNAVIKYQKKGSETLVSITKNNRPYQKGLKLKNGYLQPITQWLDFSKPRQSLEESFYVNGAIYIANSSLFLESKDFYQGQTEFYIMPEKDSIDIDSEYDFMLAEFLFSRMNSKKQS